MTRNNPVRFGVLLLVLLAMALDPTRYGAVDRLQRDAAELDRDVPRGELDAAVVDGILDDRSAAPPPYRSDRTTTRNEPEVTEHEPVSICIAATGR